MLIGFSSGKGAPGASLAVANIGVSLATAKHSVLAVDLDPAGGVLSAYLGGDPQRGLWPIAYAGAEPTPQAITEQVQVLHGLPVVGGLPRAGDAAGINLAEVARGAAGLAGVVLADAGRLPEARPVLATCDRIVLVAVADPLGILAAEQALLSLGPALAGRVSLLVTGTTYVGELRQVADLLRVPVIAGIPWVPDEVRRRRRDQRPVTGKAEKAYQKVAASLLPMTGAQALAATTRREAVTHGQ